MDTFTSADVPTMRVGQTISVNGFTISHPSPRVWDVTIPGGGSRRERNGFTARDVVVIGAARRSAA